MSQLKPDSRRATRYAHWFPIEIHSGRGEQLAVGRDASKSGILMASLGRIEVGEAVTLRCKLPGDGEARIQQIRGRVVRYELDPAVDFFPHLIAVELEVPASLDLAAAI